MSTENTVKPAIFELSPVLFAYLGGFFIFRGFYAIFPIYMQKSFNLSQETVVNQWAVITGVALSLGAVTRIPAGIISDRLGRVETFLLGFAIYFIALLLLVVKPSFLVFLISISMIRMGLNLFAMTGRAIVSMSANEPGLKNGLLSSMVGLAGFLGPWLMSIPLKNNQSNLMLVIAFIVTLFELIIFLISLKLVPKLFHHFFPDRIYDLNLQTIEHKNYVFLLSGFKKPRIYEGMFLFFSIGVVYGLISTIYTVFGYNELNFSELDIGIIVGSGSVIQVIWAPIVGKVYTKYRLVKLKELSWIIIIVAVVTLLFSTVSWIWFVLGYFLLNLGNQTFITPEITRINYTVSREEFSLIFGTTTSLIILGNALGSFISGKLYSVTQEMVFLTSTVIAVFSFIVILLNNNHTKSQPSLLGSI